MTPATKTSLVAVTSLLVGAILSDVLAKFLSPKKCNKGCQIILHTLMFTDGVAVNNFKGKWAPLAAACFQNMDDVLSCELSVHASNGLEVIIFERHVRVGHFQNQHDVLEALGVEREKEGIRSYTKSEYIESDLGHMERW